jgi:hypothetical protein
VASVNRTLKLSYVGDAKSLLAANQQAEGGLSSLGNSFKKFAKVGAVALAAVGAAGAAFAVKFGKDAVKSASDLDESINALQVTFGEASEGMLRLSDAAATAVGLSRSQFNSFAVQFAGFTKQIAGSEGDVVDVTDTLTKRIADFASVMNLDLNEAAQVFQSSLAGSSEPARRFGIDMSAAAVELFALENGLVSSKGEMTEAIKVQARYGLIMQETEKVAGDFANTSDGLANSQRVLQAKLEDVRATVGQALVPVIASLVGLIADKGLPLLEKWGAIIAENVAPVIQQLAERIKTDVVPVVSAFFGRVRDLIAVFREWWERVAPAVFESFRRLREPILELWKNIKIAFDQIGQLIGAFKKGEGDGKGFLIFIDALVTLIGLLVKGLNLAVVVMNKFRDILLRVVESKAFGALLSGIGAIGGAIGSGLGKLGGIVGLASGGIVTKPTLAMVGEGGEPEAVIPLSKMGQMGGGTVINVQVGVGDPEAIARSIERILDDSRRRTGTLVAA